MIIRASFWLSYQDSNLDKQNQKLLCYHYTIGQTYALSVKKRCKDRGLYRNIQIFRDYFFILSLFDDNQVVVFLSALHQ